LSVVVDPANVQDRDGAFDLLRRARRLFPFVKRIFADGGYSGAKMALVVTRSGSWTLQIVKRTAAAGFEVLPKRWIVERTFAWISRNRRLARDFERYATTVAAFIRLAMIRIMLRRLCRNHFAMNPNFPDGLLVAARLPAHILQKPAHRVEFRAEARPVSGF
jgi:transposase